MLSVLNSLLTARCILLKIAMSTVSLMRTRMVDGQALVEHEQYVRSHMPSSSTLGSPRLSAEANILGRFGSVLVPSADVSR